MPPRRSSVGGSSVAIEKTPEYDEFIEKLRAYHEKRGTVFDPAPKVGPVHIDLLRLYKRVLAEGGYDIASDTRGNKLAWRRIAAEFLPPNANVIALAFLVKSAYYRNLAAYEISDHHKREPPPKEILEDVSARGGDLLNRTVENYVPRVTQEAEGTANGNNTEGEDSDGKTPRKDDKMDTDEAPNIAARATRGTPPKTSSLTLTSPGLRQAPPQRILFGSQPDTPSSRARNSARHTNSPTPGGTTNANGEKKSSANVIMSYDPMPQIPLSVKQVTTPGNNPGYYREMAKRMMAQRRAAKGVPQPRGPTMLPGTGFPGPNIYVRAKLALQSGIPAEVRYALHHLVKISHERGDKFMFDLFPGLAETLMERVLKVSIPFHGIEWRVSYTGESTTEKNVLDGLSGTSDLLEKLKDARPFTENNVLSDEAARIIEDMNEAMLVLRNMSMLEQNAQYLSTMDLTRDLITIMLNLPNHPAVTESQHYALEIAEAFTKFLALDAADPMYVTLLKQLQTKDRGVFITTLRALARIANNLEAKNTLRNVPLAALKLISDSLLLPDEDMCHACLEFLHHYTAITENVEFLSDSIDCEALVHQLARMLMYGATTAVHAAPPVPRHTRPGNMAPKLSESIVQNLLKTGGEREQSAAWLRACVEEDPNSEITQLELWSAYTQSFATSPQPRHMQAKDFISNVSVTYPGANAMVVPNKVDPARPKYTIRGVRPRVAPVDPRGVRYPQCLWRSPAAPTPAPTNGVMSPGNTNGGPVQTNGSPVPAPANGTVGTMGPPPPMIECGLSVLNPQELWEHIFTVHLGGSKDPTTGKFIPPAVPEGETRTYNCHWSTCRHFPVSGVPDLRVVCNHIQVHLPDKSEKAELRRRHNRMPDEVVPEPLPPTVFFNTQVDERGEPTGIPVASVFVLRNLARQMGKIDEGRRMRDEQQAEQLVDKCFIPVRDRIFHVMAYNQTLREYMPLIEGLMYAGSFAKLQE
ncbi:hypothetical protein EJ06DRAFT_550085 [Trichodelitschia bisporula]|uniref:ARID domain-containing protein n=1 Tax=Trichodelitschia bisporula TaxID=703511 RepID=A0A6G1HS92_9PEZI|nr:hypothetical protein EJ06DRAFT_550085 [Trichodelitschia bisporula]